MPHRYELLSLIGEGGMGKVYRARHRGLDKLVALKVIDPRVGSAERFVREAHAIARLDHPGCVRIYDHAAGYIAMELLDGPTLGAVMDAGGQLPIDQALAIGKDLLAALAHAHLNGVLHCDLKPANIMIVKRGAVIIDFGLAWLHDSAKLTREGMAFGTPSYLAPERLRGDAYDARSDLYTVGVLLYEMLAGAKPFAGATRDEIMRNALDRPPLPLRAMRPGIPRALDDFVMRALAKDPARRFATAEEMRAALPVAESSTSGSTMIQLSFDRPSVWTRLATWLRYGRWRWRHRHA
ncbi:hypothetical protein BH11MYX1_BH11MYX1_35210 [soil metagenome]